MNAATTLAASVQAKKGRLYAVIQVRENGKTKPVWRALGLPEGSNKSKVNKAYREVVQAFEQSYAEQIAQNKKPASDIPIYDYMCAYFKKIEKNIQKSTAESYRGMINGRIRRYFTARRELTVGSITAKDIEDFYDWMFTSGVVANTVIHYHAIFGKAFKDAVRKDYLEVNPMLKVDRPKKNSFRPNFYTKDEVQQLLEVSQDDPLHLCILITAYYGLRRSEVLGLKWSSIDFERKSMTINHKVTEQRVNGKYVPVVSDVMKNKTSCRTLPLIPAVEAELLRQKEKQQLYRKLFKKSYSTEYLDFVCTDQEGKLIRPNFVTEHFDWLLTKYGLKHIRFHDLRHSCASLMVMNGVSMKQVQEWLGHSTFSTTADIYAHLDYKSKQGSAGVIANLLGESKLPK